MSIGKSTLDAYVAQADQAIEFQLVRNEADVDEKSPASIKPFNPEFSHQLFGDSEAIFGYRNLKIRILYTASKLFSYINMKYAEKVDPKDAEGIEADDPIKTIISKIETLALCPSLDDFTSKLKEEKSLKPFGELLHTYATTSRPEQLVNGSANGSTNGSDQKRIFEIYRSDVLVPGFKEYHERMQTFLLWFIDAASYIDADDDRWEFFTVYEKCPSDSGDGSQSYYFVGYCTVYKYYAYPDKIRPRISQMLILPPFQKMGLGAELLQTIDAYYVKDPKVLDMAVEDPNDLFLRLRDYVDAKRCSSLPEFAPESLMKGWRQELANVAREKLKIGKFQARRVYEILRLRYTNKSDPDAYKTYRLEVKKRLNAAYQREKLDRQKLERSGKLSASEIKATSIPAEVRIAQLDSEYKAIEEEYQMVIERLASA